MRLAGGAENRGVGKMRRATGFLVLLLRGYRESRQLFMPFLLDDRGFQMSGS